MSEIMYQLFTMFQAYIMRPLIWVWPLKYVLVPPGSACVRFTFGSPTVVTEPWSHRRIAFATSFQTLTKAHVARHALDSEPVSALTEDLIPVSVNVVITYTIINLADFLTQAYDAGTYVSTILEAHILNAVRSQSFQSLSECIPDLEEEMVTSLNEACGPLGVMITTVQFQNIQHLDPIVRSTAAIPLQAELLSQAALSIGADTGVSYEMALASLAPSIQIVKPVPDEDTYYDIPESPE